MGFVAAANGPHLNAYTGIAPNANIINLRFLNSQGAGTISGLLQALDGYWQTAPYTSGSST